MHQTPKPHSKVQFAQIPWNLLKRFISSIVKSVGPLILHQNEKRFK